MRPAHFPPPIGPGARVGVAALAGAVDPDRLESGLDALRSLGFEPVEASNLRRRDAIFAGTDEVRLQALHDLAADPTLGAIVFARGGHGALRLLPQIDWDLLGRIPRAWVGYSDLTPFLHALATRCRLVSFHGPMVAADFARGLTGDETNSFLAALEGRPTPLPVHFLRAGAAHGVVAAGCLSLFSNCVGTRWMPSLRGSILVLEDVGEPLYRIDRMLTHLSLSGRLDGVSGFAFGHLDGNDTTNWSSSWLAARILELGSPEAPPIAFGLPVGHSAPNLTVPVGARALLDPERQALVIAPTRRRRSIDG